MHRFFRFASTISYHEKRGPKPPLKSKPCEADDFSSVARAREARVDSSIIEGSGDAVFSTGSVYRQSEVSQTGLNSGRAVEQIARNANRAGGGGLHLHDAALTGSSNSAAAMAALDVSDRIRKGGRNTVLDGIACDRG